MNEIKELTNIQWEILSRMSSDWCYPFSYFEELNLTRKELSKEFKILREAGLVEFERGLINEEGYAAGSGYCLHDRAKDEVNRLLEDWEEKNLHAEAIKTTHSCTLDKVPKVPDEISITWNPEVVNIYNELKSK